jgi:arsenate reductase
MIKIYHNNSCSKSRTALKEIIQSGEVYEVIDYLKTPPTIAELKEILQMLRMKPLDIVRKTEKLYQEKFKNESLTDEEWISVLHENPSLIQRPILVKDNQAVIGRSEEELDKMI